jgi:hypothetical protein
MRIVAKHQAYTHLSQANSEVKVPSVIWYDQTGIPQAHGAETEDEDILVNAESAGWCKAEW